MGLLVTLQHVGAASPAWLAESCPLPHQVMRLSDKDVVQWDELQEFVCLVRRQRSVGRAVAVDWHSARGCGVMLVAGYFVVERSLTPEAALDRMVSLFPDAELTREQQQLIVELLHNQNAI